MPTEEARRVAASVDSRLCSTPASLEALPTISRIHASVKISSSPFPIYLFAAARQGTPVPFELLSTSLTTSPEEMIPVSAVVYSLFLDAVMLIPLPYDSKTFLAGSALSPTPTTTHVPRRSIPLSRQVRRTRIQEASSRGFQCNRRATAADAPSQDRRD